MKKSLQTANSNQVRRDQKRESGTHRFEILTLSLFFTVKTHPSLPILKKSRVKKINYIYIFIAFA